MILGYALGPIVLGVGLWRSGGTWLVPAALVAGLAFDDRRRRQVATGGGLRLHLGPGLGLAGAALLRGAGDVGLLQLLSGRPPR